MILDSVAASADPELAAPAWADRRACRSEWAACWLVDRAVQADSGAAPVDPAAVQADEVDPVGPAAVVVPVAAAPVAADAADAMAVSVDPADPAPASATANVKVDRTFAAW